MAHQVILRGCTTEPMAGYLKALAVFRLVSEQADPRARGWWAGNSFCLDSKFDEETLLQFFLDEYVPTPIVAPWHAKSGFGEDEATEGFQTIAESDSPRLLEYRQTIDEIMSWPEFGGPVLCLRELMNLQQEAIDSLKPGKSKDTAAQKLSDVTEALDAAGHDHGVAAEWTTEQLPADDKKLVKAVKKLRTVVKAKRRKAIDKRIVATFRNRLSDRAVDWLDCVAVLRNADSLDYPRILGTGGNDGNQEFTTAFMAHLCDMLLGPRERSERLLKNALFGEPTADLARSTVGQHDPGRCGGFNQGPGIEEDKSPSNPWNFIATLEGSVAWVSGVAKRYGPLNRAATCSPFTVRASAVGYGSAESSELKEAHGEIWMPIWTRKAVFSEIQALLREGRAEFGGRPARDGLEFALAAASLGMDRGIAAFQRYSLVKRRGNNFVALPIGRVPVHEQKDSDLLQELDRVLQTVDGFARGFKSGTPPAQFASRRRQIDAAIYDFALRGGAERFQQILAALGRLEQFFAQRSLSLDPKLRAPLSGLSPRWLLAANDGSLNYRIAVALASIGRTGGVGGIRANLAPVEPTKPWAWANGKGQVAFQGSSLSERLVSVLRRRLIDAERVNCESLPLWAAVTVAPEDAAAFLMPQNVDESRIEELLFGLALIKWDDSSFEAVRSELHCSWQPAGTIIPRNYALLKHLFQPSVDVRTEPSILSLLVAGRTEDACDVAHRRLRNSGLCPRNASFPDGQDGVRLAASLLIPIHPIESLSRLVLRVDREAATQTTGR